ncbi:MAG TPA: HEPN domain-containing protein [Firmicutes bacterium]|nr:HEPN domain-containing protein [Bacillota bacterium]
MTKREWVEEGERWLKQAESNREVAGHDQAGGFHNAACFWAQQAAEAALKAFLYARGFDVRGHSIADLAERAAGLDTGFGPLAEELAPLDQYYIPTRYPNGLAAPSIPARAFNRQDSSRALELADRVLAFVSEKIGLLRASLGVEPGLADGQEGERGWRGF